MKVENVFKIQDVAMFSSAVEEMDAEELKELQRLFQNKINHMVFDPDAVLKLSIVETKLERIEDGETK